jgi:metal-responsive CopG/Arc/MetJ family transcriptional regulator
MERVVKTLRFSKDLLEEIDTLLNKENMNFTDFITIAAKFYLSSLKFTEAVKESAGAWDLKNQPELKEGSESDLWF